MEQLVETFILPINITMHEDSPTKKLDYSMYNEQLLVSTCDIACVVNVRCFYVNEDGKLHLHVIVKQRFSVLKKHQFFSLNVLK